ncbi:hypothetical protein [Antrihabitans cavernicola]|uniref:Uncharacterized protein n=1 Tax=Antrihabitans cavernicola TaxID=2495913 RepID=A0A5A7S4S5_9NOCA|nr:hypothetical protein [Spelaeibacter cavernicola]KAA0018467.1 hypothetical protein FOY51_23575 [Spelaeibacter cavernicola]
MHPVAKKQRLEVLIGILGFFTSMAFISALVGIVSGDPGVVPSLVLAVCVVLSVLAIAARRRVVGR